MASDFCPIRSKALERAFAGQRAFEAAIESQQRIQAFLQPPTLAEIHKRQQLMNAVWERQRLFEQAWEAQGAVERAWGEQLEIERAVSPGGEELVLLPSLEAQRRMEEERRSLESTLVERNRLMTELDAAAETQRRIAEFTSVPEELVSSTRMAEEAYTQAVWLRDISVQFDNYREYIDRFIAKAVPSLPDVPAAQVAARLSESLSATLAAEAEAEAEPETRAYGAAAIMRFAIAYRRSIESLPAEWQTPSMQVALINLQVTLYAFLLALALGIITLVRPQEGPTQEQFQEFADGVLSEEKHRTALAQSDSAMTDSLLAEERKQTQLLETILEQGEPLRAADSAKTAKPQVRCPGA
jgi:hypothetical protein